LTATTVFTPGMIVRAEIPGVGWPTVKFSSWIDVFGKQVEVGDRDLGIVIRQRIAINEPDVWIYMIDSERTIVTGAPDCYFNVCYTPRDDVRDAIEACVMAEEHDAAVRIALDDWQAVT
jgi:hypothetical protein